MSTKFVSTKQRNINGGGVDIMPMCNECKPSCFATKNDKMMIITSGESECRMPVDRFHRGRCSWDSSATKKARWV